MHNWLYIKSYARGLHSGRGGRLAVMLAVGLYGAAAADPVALRLAVEDLAATHGGGYPGAVFQERLADITARLAVTGLSNQAAADLAQLEREALLANPLLQKQPLLFVVRKQFQPDHHNTATFFPSAAHERNDGTFTSGAALKVLDVKSGTVRTLWELPAGVVRDPEVDFDGQRIVCSARTNLADSYHVYEIRADGSGLRALTRAREVDDLDPVWTADGGIVFSSTREPKYCMCNRHIMANLFRMDGDGANPHQIGKSTLFEGHATAMPDGRLLYDRWEYVDRNFGDAQSLWTVNPDGTGHALYWGNNTASPGAVIDGRIIPGTQRAVCIFSSCHDRPWGALAVVDPARGLDGAEPVVQLWPATARKLIQETGWQLFDAFKAVKLKYEDPWPLSEKYFLCSRMTGRGEEMGIYLVDVFGNEVLVHGEGPGCYDPQPLGPRPRPPVLAGRRDFTSTHGYAYVQDVYQGTHMAGVARGTVKSLRVVETPEKRYWTGPGWDGQGQEAPAMNWHDFNNKRILGTVPVEADGSVYVALPAEKFVYLQLLDERGMMVQSMRSGMQVQPGETTSCAGCHEDRRSTALAGGVAGYRADHLRQLSGWQGAVREFSYRRDVQPVFDRHCLKCHDYGQEAAGHLLLAPDRDLVFNTSYNELWRKKMIKVVGAGPAAIQPARSWGSAVSRLAQVLVAGHHEVKLAPEEFERVVTWIDLNAPYYPSYASAHPNHLAGRSPLDDRQLARLEKLTGVELRKQASHHGNRGPQITFERPELSPVLAGFTNRVDPARLEALAIIEQGRAQLAAQPEADAEGFTPSERDQWREQKYQARQQAETRHREAIRQGRKEYDRVD